MQRRILAHIFPPQIAQITDSTLDKPLHLTIHRKRHKLRHYFLQTPAHLSIRLSLQQLSHNILLTPQIDPLEQNH